MKAISIQKYFVLAVFTAFFAEYSYSQCHTVGNTFSASRRCRMEVDGAIDYRLRQRVNYLDSIDSSFSFKKKDRSIFVNQSVNGVGGFAVIDTITKDVFYANPNGVGSTFAIDVDGNCVYEREDELLEWLVQQKYSEIILYNVSNILSHGDSIANTYTGFPFNNEMGEIKPFDWHLSRFIYKAKSVYNLNVVAVVPEDIGGQDGNPDTVYNERFYKFHLNFSRSHYEFYINLLGDYTTHFVDKYIDMFQHEPWNLRYLGYGEDTLFLPVDDDGRISHIDKAIVDIYNFHLFQFKTQTGLIHNGGLDGDDDDSDACNSLPTENSCEKGFDAHMFEFEWWNNIESEVDAQMHALEGLVAFSRSLEQSYSECLLGLYICQDAFEDTGWTITTYTAQERANLVDSLADRIYLYTYHANPCDCYTGSQSSVPKMFSEKVSLLANNGFGANNGQSVIVPVFNGKYTDYTLFNSPKPQVYGDGNRGCGGSSVRCDYCADFSGKALNDFALDSFPRYLNYIENVFQDQYNLDSSNTAYPHNSDNIIHSYSWFKSSILIDNNFLSSIPKRQKEFTDKTAIYPNPSNSGVFEVRGQNKIKEVRVYALNGSLVLQQNVNAEQTSFVLAEQGVYIVQLQFANGEFETAKVVKL